MSLPTLSTLPRSLADGASGLAESATTAVARSADVLGMWLMSQRLFGRDYRPELVQRTRVDLSPYLAVDDPAVLYPEPAYPAQVHVSRSANLLDADDRGATTLWGLPQAFPEGGALDLERRDFRFESAYEPMHPDFGEQLASTPENGKVHGRVYAVAGSRPRHAVICLHHFADSSLDNVARFVPPVRLARRDTAVVLMSLPYHGPRRPAGARFDGEYFLSGDTARTLEATLQAVWDVRRVVGWLRGALGIERVGLMGGSLGGFIATLTAAVDARLDFLVAVAPPIRLTHCIDLPIGRHMRAGLSDLEDGEIAAMQRLADPGNFRPVLRRDRMLFIAGRGDRFCVPAHLEGLAEAWGDLDVRWHPWGHATALLGYPPARIFDEVEELLDRIGFGAA